MKAFFIKGLLNNKSISCIKSGDVIYLCEKKLLVNAKKEF